MFSAVTKVRVSEQVAARVRETILSGKLKPGERLPSERDLAQQFGVNRASVREAMKILEQYNLVRVHHGGGAEVADFWSEGGLELLPFLLLVEGQFDRSLLENLLEVRRLFCREMARLAAERGDETLIADLRAVHDAVLAAGNDVEAIQQADFEFFYTLAVGCGNRVFMFLMNMIRTIYMSHCEFFRGIYSDLPTYVAAQAAIIDAVEKKDSARAQEITDQLMRASASLLVGID